MKLPSEWTAFWETLRSRNPRRGHSDSNVPSTNVLLCPLCSLRSSHSTMYPIPQSIPSNRHAYCVLSGRR